MNSLDERSAPIRVLESQPALEARMQLDTEPDQDPVKLNLGSTIFESVQGYENKSVLTAVPKTHRRFGSLPGPQHSTESFKHLFVTEEDYSPRQQAPQPVKVFTSRKKTTRHSLLETQFKRSKEIYERIFSEQRAKEEQEIVQSNTSSASTLPLAKALTKHFKKKLLTPEEDVVDEARLSVIASSIAKSKNRKGISGYGSIDLEGIDPRYQKDSLNETFSAGRRMRDSLPSLTSRLQRGIKKMLSGSEIQSMESFDNS